MTLYTPQIIYLALFFMSMGLVIARFGEDKGEYGLSDIVGGVVVLGVLYWGGFFG